MLQNSIPSRCYFSWVERAFQNLSAFTGFNQSATQSAQGRAVLFTTDMWKSNQTLSYMAPFLCLHLFKVLTEPWWNNSAVCKSPCETSFIMKLIGKPEHIAEGPTSQKARTDNVLMFPGFVLCTWFCLPRPHPPPPPFQTLNIWTLGVQSKADRMWATHRGFVLQLLKEQHFQIWIIYFESPKYIIKSNFCVSMYQGCCH